ncbi:MAG TPA: UvrD-helicase domain-containing protein [Acidobacteriota bacterium]|nr:UvrD-helicase domain-containing protein [Acidobacteriota bacterium]
MSVPVYLDSSSLRPSPGDAQQRSQAILTEEHAFVWAGAGTGKTHTLTHRALYLLLRAPFLECFQRSHQEAAGVDLTALYRSRERSGRMGAARRVVRSLVLTTFTRKAAAEMQTRLHQYLGRVARLQEAELDDPPPKDVLLAQVVDQVLSELKSKGYQDPLERLRLGAGALSELAADMQISTLHSFAAGLLKRHPLQAAIAPGAHFAREDETDLSTLPRRLIDRWWNRCALSDSALQEDLRRVLEAVPVRQLEQWLEQTLFHPWLAQLDAGESENADQALRSLTEVVQQLHRHWPGKPSSRLEELTKRLYAVLHTAATPADRQSGDFDWSAVDPKALGRLLDFTERIAKSLFLDSSRRWKTLDKALQASPAHARRFFRTPSHLRRPLVARLLGTRLAPARDSLRRLLQHFEEWSRGAALRELKLVTFDDMIEKAVTLLREHPDIRRREQGRLAVLLVDEFQDTDPLQLHLIELLLRRSRKGRGPLGFFVGDRKQSIYRFRGVDLPALEAFFSRYQEIAGVPPREFQLTTSFRSLKPVLDFVNAFFQEQVPAAQSQESLQAFRRPRSAQPPAPGAGRAARDQMALPFQQGERPQWIYLRDQRPQGRGFSASEARRVTASQAVRTVGELCRQGYAYKEVSLLVRKERELDPILEALRHAGIPYVSTGARTFYRQAEVLDLLNLLIALHHPGDTLACAAVLRGPWVGLHDEALHGLLSLIEDGSLLHGEDPLPPELPDPARENVEALRDLVRQRRLQPTQDWLQQIRNRLPLEAYVSRHDHEGRSLVRMERLLDNYRLEVEQGSEPVLLWLLEQRQRADRGDRFDADLGEDVSISDDTLDAVRVLTIHKAKGLENRAVVVCGWHAVLEELKGDFPAGDPPLLDDFAAPGQRRRGEFLMPFGPLKVESAGYARALQEEKQHNRGEAMRLAYVAATRARDQLILICAQHCYSRPSPEMDEFLAQACQTAEQTGGRAELCGGTLHFRLLEAGQARSKKAPVARWELGEDYERLWQERRRRCRQWLQQPLWRSPTDELGRTPQEIRDPDPDWRLPDIAEDEAPMSEEDRGIRRRAGEIVHRWLEDWDGQAFPGRARLERELSSPGPAASRLPKEMEERSVERAVVSLLSFLQGEALDDQGRPLIRRFQSARVLAKELPVHLQYRREPWFGVVDLVLEEGETITAVDYKTGLRPRELPPHYRLQSELYGEALRRLFPQRRVGVEFWWLEGAGRQR